MAVKVLVLGDAGVGKSCLRARAAGEAYPAPAGAQPAVAHAVEVDGAEVELEILEGSNDFAKRSAFYPNVDVIILCFSIVDPLTLLSISRKWFPEVTEHAAGAKLLVVGTKQDLFSDEETNKKLLAEGHHPVFGDDGQKLAEIMGAVGYMECSAKDENGVAAVFEAAARAATAQ